MPSQGREELVAEDERALCKEDPQHDEALERHNGIALPRCHGAEAVNEGCRECRNREA